MVKMWYIYIAMFAARCLYYVAWKLTDTAISLSGISYDETTKKFDKIVSVDIWNIEFGDSAKTMIDSWNHMTAVWLKHYVYERCPKKYGPTLVTFMVSAFWHGFYPNYYWFFFNAFLITECSRIIFKNRHLFSFMPPKL